MSTASIPRQEIPKVGGFSGSAPRNIPPRNSNHRTPREEGKIMSQSVRPQDGGGEGDNDDNEAETVISLGHEALKKHRVFKKFFESMDALTLKEVNNREWTCPACRGGVGAANNYKGLKPLIDHAKNVRQWNVRLHRKFMKVLEEESKRRSAAGFVVQEVYGKWLNLQEQHIDAQVVWPPMVIVENTGFKPQESQQAASEIHEGAGRRVEEAKRHWFCCTGSLWEVKSGISILMLFGLRWLLLRTPASSHMRANRYPLNTVDMDCLSTWLQFLG